MHVLGCGIICRHHGSSLSVQLEFCRTGDLSSASWLWDRRVVCSFWYSCRAHPVGIPWSMLVSVEYFWSIGTMFTAALAWGMLDSMGWRWFVGFCSIPVVLALCGFFIMPESPYWLLTQGRNAEAMDVLRRLGALNGTCRIFRWSNWHWRLFANSRGSLDAIFLDFDPIVIPMLNKVQNTISEYIKCEKIFVAIIELRMYSACNVWRWNSLWVSTSMKHLQLWVKRRNCMWGGVQCPF